VPQAFLSPLFYPLPTTPLEADLRPGNAPLLHMHESKRDNAYAQNFIASTITADTMMCCPLLPAV
jgi:hypothetical protein